MTEKLRFDTDAAIIDRLGRELVAKHTTALIEIIKNSFDADATEVDVSLEGDGDERVLIVRDNGSGMSHDDIVNGYLRLASDNKVNFPVSKKYKRFRAGRKGIGRLSTQRLASRLILTTCNKRGQDALQLTINWNEFVSGRDLKDIRVNLREVPWEFSGTGTVLRMEGLRDDWSKRQLQSSWRGVLALQKPISFSPNEHDAPNDPGFKVRLLIKGAEYADEEEVIDFKSEILRYMPCVFELRVDDQGYASWRISKNDFGPVSNWTKIHHEHEGGKIPPYANLRSVKLKTYYAVLDPALIPSSVYSRVRYVLAEQGGIRLYRNGFRVSPYGDADNDWLHLDETYAKRSALAPMANRNFFGLVDIYDPTGGMFEEHTSREGLIENEAFEELRDLASVVLITAATSVAADRGRKTNAGGPAKPKAHVPEFDEILASARSAREAAQVAVREKDALKGTEAAAQIIKAADQVAAIVARKQQEEKEHLAQVADESAMLRFLATLGMTMAEFSHETGMTFNAFRLDFKIVFDVAKGAKGNDPAFMEQANRASAMLVRLDSLTAYLNTLAAARAARGMQPVSLKKVVDEFVRGVSGQAAIEGIELKTKFPPYEPLFTRPLHQAELASVLLNLYTNAVKAMRAVTHAKRILVSGDEIIESKIKKIRLRFSDTGVGVQQSIANRIFDPFFTTRLAPPGRADDVEHASGSGLGLWIVRQIAENAKGAVRLVEPPKGFATCFEVVMPAEEDDD